MSCSHHVIVWWPVCEPIDFCHYHLYLFCLCGQCTDASYFLPQGAKLTQRMTVCDFWISVFDMRQRRKRKNLIVWLMFNKFGLNRWLGCKYLKALFKKFYSGFFCPQLLFMTVFWLLWFVWMLFVERIKSSKNSVFSNFCHFKKKTSKKLVKKTISNLHFGFHVCINFSDLLSKIGFRLWRCRLERVLGGFLWFLDSGIEALSW